MGRHAPNRENELRDNPAFGFAAHRTFRRQAPHSDVLERLAIVTSIAVLEEHFVTRVIWPVREDGHLAAATGEPLGQFRDVKGGSDEFRPVPLVTIRSPAGTRPLEATGEPCARVPPAGSSSIALLLRSVVIRLSLARLAGLSRRPSC